MIGANSLSVHYVAMTVEIADNFMTGKNIVFDRVSSKIKWLDISSCKIQILIPSVLKRCGCVLEIAIITNSAQEKIK